MTLEGQVDTGRTTHLPQMHRQVPWKTWARVATTANGTLASAFENGDTVDGVTLATGDRILLKNQTATEENGLYVVQASGVPFRAFDMDDIEEVQGAVVLVLAGTANAGTLWYTTSTPAVLDDDAIVWAQFTGGLADLSGVNFLVGTATGLLSAEIVAGTSPGGELGGTWASPTVDATHAGSTHVTAHSGLTGLTSGDDHTQYVENADDIMVAIVVDGGGAAITTGIKAAFKMPRAGHFRANATIASPKESGSIVFDVWVHAGSIPTVAHTITASAKPTLSTSQLNDSASTMSGWTTAFSAGDWVVINVDSATTTTLATLSLPLDWT